MYTESQFMFGYNGTLYAGWVKSVNIKFELNGGSGGYYNQSIKSGNYFTVNGSPTRSGYTFASWYTDKNFKNP